MEARNILVTVHGHEYSVKQKNGGWCVFPTPLHADDEIEVLRKANRTVNGYYESLQGSIIYMEGLGSATRITMQVAKLIGDLLANIVIDEDPTRSGYDTAYSPKIVFHNRDEFEIIRKRPNAAAPLGLRALFTPTESTMFPNGKPGWNITIDTGTGAKAADRLHAWLPSSDPAVGRLIDYINRYTRMER